MLGRALDIFGNIITFSFLGLSYSRVEIAAAARQWLMKLYLNTANGLQRCRCSDISSPVGQKMPKPTRPTLTLKDDLIKFLLLFTSILGQFPDIDEITLYIGIFYK
jgi:hypothetical protein